MTGNDKDAVSRYKVTIDDNFHFMDESESYQLGVFSTATEAIAACQRIIDENLEHMKKSAMTADELYFLYAQFGEDPFILPVEPTDNPVVFSARDYAKKRSRALSSRSKV